MHTQRASLRRILILVGVLALPLLTIAASAGVLHTSTAKTTQVSQSNVSQTASVSMVDFAFDPKVITITAGTSIRWTNNGTSVHTTTSDTPGLWDSGDIAPGGSYTVTFNTPGVFPYQCIHHAPLMVGTVVVLGDIFLPMISR
jgi:plastocyanin